MTPDGLHRLSATELLDGYAARRLSPVEVVDALVERITALDPAVGAVWTLVADEAREAALTAERNHRDGSARPLEGVPFLCKDAFDTAGIVTTYGSGMFREHRPPTDAVAVRRMRAAGAILLGKAAMHEFACGGTGINPHYGTTHNPWDTDRIAGGSSGGSAAALAAGMAPLALGSDTAGSIRMPAALCGVVGLKPSFGRISVVGSFPQIPSMDHAGPMARTVEDVSLMLSVLDGDGGAPPGPRVDGERLEGLRVGLIAPFDRASLRDEAERATAAAALELEALGAAVDDVELADLGRGVDVLRVIQAFELPFVHSVAGLFPERRDEYGIDVRTRLDGGVGRSSDEYFAAGALRRTITAALTGALDEFDVLLSPTVGFTAPTIAEATIRDGELPNALIRGLLMHTVPQALAGLPACSVPTATHEGLPIGVQVTGPFGGEDSVLRVAARLATSLEPGPGTLSVG